MALVMPTLQDGPAFDGMCVEDEIDIFARTSQFYGTGVISGCQVTQNASRPQHVSDQVTAGVVAVQGNIYTYGGTGLSPLGIVTAGAGDRRDTVVLRLFQGATPFVLGAVVTGAVPSGLTGAWTRNTNTLTALPPLKGAFNWSLATPTTSVDVQTDVVLAEVYVAFNTTSITGTAASIINPTTGNIVDKTGGGNQTVGNNLTVAGDMTLPVSTLSTTTGKFVGGAIREAIGIKINNTYNQTVGPIIGCTAGSPSVGTSVSSLTTFTITDTVNPPTTGQLNISTSTGTAVINYTSFNSGTKTFGGVTLVSGTGTVTNAAEGVSTTQAGTDQLLGTPLRIQYNPTIEYLAGPLGPVTVSGAVDGPAGLVEVEGTYVFKQSDTALFGIGPVFQNEMQYKNDPGSTGINFCVGEGFVNVPVATGDTVAANFVPINSGFNIPGQDQNWTIGFTDIPVFNTINGGSLGATNPGQTLSFFSWAVFGAGTTVSQRIGLLVHDATVSGTLTNQLGIVIGNLQEDGVSLLPLAGGANNVGISTASPIRVGASTTTFTALPYGSAVSLLPNTYTYNYSHSAIPTGFTVGGTHITTTDGNNGFATQFIGTSVSSIIKNSATGTTPNFGIIIGSIFNTSVTADTLTLTGGNLVGFNASPTVGTANAGSLAQGAILGFQFGPTVGSGATASVVAGLSIADAGGTGTVTTQVGVDMPILLRGATNIGFRYGQGGQTLTALPGGNPISIYPGTTTLNFANAALPTAINMVGTYSFAQGGQAFGSVVGLTWGPTLVNTSTSANGIGFGLTSGFNVNPTFHADTKTGIGIGTSTGYLYNPITGVVNSGTLTSGTLQGFLIQGTIGAGTTVTGYTGILIQAPTITGTLTAWTGININAVTGAGTNAGIINASPYVATPSTAQVVSAGFTVTANAEHVQLTSTGAVSATTAAAVIAVPGNNGQKIYIVNANTTTANTMTFTSGTTEKLSLGATTRAVGAGGSLSLIYNSTFGRWVEFGFNVGGN